MYIQLWDQNYLSYGIRSRAFFDEVSIIWAKAWAKALPTRDDSFSGLESLTLIALSLTMPPFVERFQQRDDPCLIDFYAL